MGANSHFTVALHILSRIRYEQVKKGDLSVYVTSQAIAESVNTHAVFIRRILGSLHKAGLVDVRRGNVNGGWKLTRSTQDITLLDVYDAVVDQPLQEMHHSKPNQRCSIGRGIQPTLRKYYGAAEQAFREELSRTNMETIYEETMVLAVE
ncbi:Rrf2 family transcriptional regulator [Paenibacillus radicis (ex Gao et al. 2016)]|uniref:Rrf2 family transcriptional regulator n=1 Tax=Paenibacillus radicis (ex Gao et al. 2016) TaxID=1737354 RepID=A0A917GR31_9BACL|nr:Rrf2 family transcriptional regulator [Paenibacillus radicis (ex Gao et al. 2016)]GGG54626.1 Rrf2 family transcriptional regulator [Paenibacillus radicis (ex Gao et al. 2016)]